MTVSTSLYELILNLLRDPKALADFQDDPNSYLASCGDFSSQDVKDAIELVRDSNDDDDDRNGRDHGGKDHVHVAPPSNPPEPHHGESEHEAAVRYLNTYVTNNYIDDRDTNIDNSVNQQVDTHGGDFDQNIDVDTVNAVGDGSVAAGGDIEGSTITTGDDNQVGDGNVRGDGNVVGDHNQAVTGNDNTTGFGEGDVNNTDIGGDVEVGDGGGFNTGSGDVTIDNIDNSAHDSLNTEASTHIEDSNNQTLDESTHDSHDTSTEAHVEDSFNDSSDNSTETDTSTHDSDNTDLHL